MIPLNFQRAVHMFYIIIFLHCMGEPPEYQTFYTLRQHNPDKQVSMERDVVNPEAKCSGLETTSCCRNASSISCFYNVCKVEVLSGNYVAEVGRNSPEKALFIFYVLNLQKCGCFTR